MSNLSRPHVGEELQEHIEGHHDAPGLQEAAQGRAEEHQRQGQPLEGGSQLGERLHGSVSAT
eukprot:1017625-Heterocapsa_arctica.AAC.1